MGRPPDRIIELDSKTIELCEYESGGHTGFWLYDTTRGFNLAMRAKTEREAFVEALHYYQKRLTEVERNYNNLQGRVNEFVSQFVEEESDD